MSEQGIIFLVSVQGSQGLRGETGPRGAFGNRGPRGPNGFSITGPPVSAMHCTVMQWGQCFQNGSHKTVCLSSFKPVLNNCISPNVGRYYGLVTGPPPAMEATMEAMATLAMEAATERF